MWRSGGLRPRERPTRPRRLTSAALADEREDTTAGLTIARERLRDSMDGKQMLGLRGMARARFKVRELETKQRELDRLIAALGRFSAMWSAGR